MYSVATNRPEKVRLLKLVKTEHDPKLQRSLSSSSWTKPKVPKNVVGWRPESILRLAYETGSCVDSCAGVGSVALA